VGIGRDKGNMNLFLGISPLEPGAGPWLIIVVQVLGQTNDGRASSSILMKDKEELNTPVETIVRWLSEGTTSGLGEANPL
jgi:hypothetical protein